MTDSAPKTMSPVTGNPSRHLFNHVVLGKYDAEYYFDESIGYIFVREPHWLPEAYSDAIAVTDTGILARNIRNVRIVSQAITLSHYPFTQGVDIGGGYGLFVRGVRDAGHNFFWTDPHATNLLARGFEATRDRYGVAVAFEVLEHLQNPLEFLRVAREEYDFDTCFISATCFEERRIPPEDWWYWAFESGQHISFFSPRSLQWLADQLDLRLWHIESDIYALSTFRWTSTEGTRRLGQRLNRRIRAGFGMGRQARPGSLTFTDHIMLRDRMRSRFTDQS